MVDLDSVIVLDHSPIVEFLMNLVFSERMLNVVVLDLVDPRIIERVNFTSDFSTHFNVKGLVDLREASFAKH